MSDDGKITKSIFDLESDDRVKSPEKIDEYIRVATPGVWLIISALTLVFAALLLWGFIGELPVHYLARGVGLTFGVNMDKADMSDPAIFNVMGTVCFADPANVSSHDLQGKRAVVTFSDGTRREGSVVLLDTSPLNFNEIEGLLEAYRTDSSWAMSQLEDIPYAYVMYVVLDDSLDYLYWGEVAEVSIIIDEVQPITLLTGNGG